MTIYGHIKTMLNAKVSELKARLSSYLAKARAGDTVTILDRRTPIAKLVPLGAEPDLLVREATAPRAALSRIKGVRLRAGVDVVALLRADREAR